MTSDRRNGGTELDDDEGVEIYSAAGRREGVPEANRLPLERSDYGIDVSLRIYLPDVEKYEAWDVPVAERL